MTSGRIVIVSGPPGAGKSTVARALAEAAPAALAVHLHTDDFYAYIRKGFIEPWRPESMAQNITVGDAMAGASATYARGGYETLVDGIVGPWFFAPWQAVRDRGVDVRYVLLMPSQDETAERCVNRDHVMTDPKVSRFMWRQFREHAPPDDNILDTTGEPAEATAARVAAGLADGAFRLP